MIRLLLNLAVTFTLLACPITAQAQSPAATPGQTKLTPGVPPCAKGDFGMGSFSFITPKKAGECTKFGDVNIPNLRVWQALKPYMSSQDALEGLVVQLPMHAMEDVLKSVPNPSKVGWISLSAGINQDFDALPPGLSRYNNLKNLSIYNWDGDAFPDPWIIGTQTDELMVTSATNIAPPRSMFEQPKLEYLTYRGSYRSPLALKLMNIPKADILARKLVGLPAGICSQRIYPRNPVFEYVRKGKPNLKIEAPYINDYCPSVGP